MAITLYRPTYDSSKKVLGKFKGSYIHIVYEAGPCGFDLYDRLTADGIECIVTPPSLISIESGNIILFRMTLAIGPSSTISVSLLLLCSWGHQC